MNKILSTYIHIPFCKSVCTYCDFCRIKISPNTNYDDYCKKIIKEINNVKEKQNTIYIGGGTPNAIPNNFIIKILTSCQRIIKKNTEFTIECNPEFINQEQIEIFKKYNINRVSLGAQSINNKILKKYNRIHTWETVENALTILKKNNFKNISLDFIYGFFEDNLSDVKKILKFIIKNKIPHISFYQLEIKDGSLLNKKNKIDEEKTDIQLKTIIATLKNNNYKRYEISNWCLNKKFESEHNKTYWRTNQWHGIGWGASGFIKKTLYKNVGNINKWKKENTRLTLHDYYFQIIYMGLRMTDGINLRIKKNILAYTYFKDKFTSEWVTYKNNYVRLKNINLINSFLESFIY